MALPSRSAALAAAAAALVGWLVGASPARGNDYTTGGAFLPLGHGARAHALGGASIVLARDDVATYWNPANLGWMEGRPGITLMHAEILPEIQHGYDTISYARRAGRRLGEPEQVLRPSRWGYGVFASHFGIDFESGDWSETAVQLAGSVAINNFTTVGAGIKMLQLRNEFEAGDASGAGLDLAATVLVTDRVSGAFVVRDAWTRLGWDTNVWETLSPSLQAGLEIRPRAAWTAEADVVLRERNLRRVQAGLEWRAVRDVLALRGGVTVVRAGQSRAWPSGGAGVRFGRFVVDYAASFDGEDALGFGQRVSLRVGL